MNTNTGDFVIDPDISFYKILQGLLGHAPRLSRWIIHTDGVKTTASNRDVPWFSFDSPEQHNFAGWPSNDDFLDMLYWALYKRSKLVSNMQVDHGYLFVSRAHQSRGNPITNKSVYSKFSRIAEALMKRRGIDLTYFSPHTFRHLFATELIRRFNTPIMYIQQLLGHSSDEITKQTYIHFMPEKNIGQATNTIRDMLEVFTNAEVNRSNED